MYRNGKKLFSTFYTEKATNGCDEVLSWKRAPLDGRVHTLIQIALAKCNLLSSCPFFVKNVLKDLIHSEKNLMAVVFRKRYLWSIISQQKRLFMNSKFDFNKAKEELQSNPFYDKYSEKIKKLQQSDPDEFKRKLEGNDDNKKPNFDNIPNKKVIYGDKKGPSVSQTKSYKKLDEVMKMSLLTDKTKEEIIDIWTEYHKSKDVVFGTLEPNVFNIIESHRQKYPTFLLPLPRSEGYEFILLQFEQNEVHFTPLISYQSHKADAPECLTLFYYTDLKESKEIILMKGEYDKNILSILEAQCLVNTFHLYYGEENEKRNNLMQIFTNNPDNFRYMDLVAEIDSITLKG